MSRVVRMLLLCCTVGVTFAALGGSSVMAVFTLTSVKCEGTGVATLCYSTTEKAASGFLEFSGEEELKLKAESQSVFIIPSLGLVMLFAALKGEKFIAHQTKPLVKAYSLTGKLVFENVTVTEPSTCKLPSPTIITEALKGVPNSKSTELTLEPESGSTGALFPWTLEGAECPLTLVGTNKVKGTQKCTIPSSAEDLKIHLLACLASGSSLKFAGTAATFEGTAEGELTNSTTDFYSGQEA